jgi:hypothetical protein
MKKIVPCCFILCLSAVIALSQPTVSAASPSSQTVCSGSSATFTVTATGTPTLTYQWQVSTNGSTWTALTDGVAGSGAAYSGSAASTLTITNVPTTLNSNSFRCVVTNSQGSATSVAGVLNVNASPPGLGRNFGLPSCSTDLFNTTNAGDPSLNYQWQTSTDNGATWSNITDGAVYSGSSTNDLVWNVSMALNGNLIRYIVTDPANNCSTTSAYVDTIIVIGSPSVLTPSPISANICPGATANFAITDSVGVSYQWQISTNGGASWTNTTNGPTYSGSTTNTLTITGATTAARYRVQRSVTGDDFTTCPTPSNYAPLSIKTVTSITGQPANATVCAGSAASFHVTASGTGPITYQWQTDNGTSPSVWTNTGTNVATLSSGAATTAMNGYHYQVLVQGACGTQLTSSEVALGVHSSGTWLGSADVKWEDAANWCGGIPTPSTNVLIPAGTTFSPTISTATGIAYSAQLNILSGAILTISGGTTTMTGPYSILGTIAYTAAGNQTILPADHGSLIIGGSGNKTLSANTGITNTLTLGGTAMLVTGSDLLTMYAGSNPISGTAPYGSAASSWIVTGNGSSGAGNTGLGGLKLAGIGSAAAAFFPVGPTPTAYAPAQLTNSGSINDFTVAVNDQYIPGGPANATVDRTWLVSGATPGTGNINLGLQWNLADEGSLFNRASAAVIQSNGTNIIQVSPAGAAAGSSPYSLAEGGFPTFTQFSVATNSMVVLPVQLLSFTGQWLNNNSVNLTWTSNQESQAASFIVQHSTDGVTFHPIGTVDATRATTAYGFIDPQPFTGNNTYRLQIVAADGSTSYSQVVRLDGAAMSDQAALAPSVTENGAASLLLSLDHSANIVYTLTNIPGNILMNNAVRLPGGQHTLPLDLSRYPAGVYFVHITGSDGYIRTLTVIRK